MSCLSLFVLAVMFGVASVESILVVDITGGGLELDNRTTKNEREYMYKFNNTVHLNLSCTLSGAKGMYQLELKNDQNDGPTEKHDFGRNLILNHSVSYTFNLTPQSTMIHCTARDVGPSGRSYTSTVHLKYKPAPPETSSSSSTFPSETTSLKPTTTPNQRSSESQTPDPTIPWKFIAIGAAAFVTLCVVILSLVLVCRQKKRQINKPLESSYSNLTNDTQNSYQNMPVPAPRKALPTVEGTYSCPKDFNDMSEALYADPNVTRAAGKSEDTYAEPYNAKSELYATPVPKAQRTNKFKDDPNYSNVYGKYYVNSKGK